MPRCKAVIPWLFLAKMSSSGTSRRRNFSTSIRLVLIAYMRYESLSAPILAAMTFSFGTWRISLISIGNVLSSLDDIVEVKDLFIFVGIP